MALTSTIFTLAVELSDIDRGVYESFEMKVAQHPSEGPEYMAARVLAYCLEYTEGIAFSSGGVSSPDEPAIMVRDLTGRITTWIDIGMPDADRLHRASKSAERVAVYTHRDRRQLASQLEGKKIHRREAVEVYAFDRAFIAGFAARIERRTAIALSVTERHLYLDVAGVQLTSVVEKVPL
jgi:uncharacterized protein YaeQ